MTEQLTVEIDVKSVMDHKETWKTHRKAPLFALLNVLFTIYNLQILSKTSFFSERNIIARFKLVRRIAAFKSPGNVVIKLTASYL